MDCVQAAFNEGIDAKHGGQAFSLRLTLDNGTVIEGPCGEPKGDSIYVDVPPTGGGTNSHVYVSISKVAMASIVWFEAETED